jgi:IS5 family transposase
VVESVEGSCAEQVNERYLSTTDPDASIIRGGGQRNLQYQTHRAVDPSYEVITTTEMTPGDVHEGHLLTSLLDGHQANTGKKAETVVADSKYGTIENYVACHDRGVRAHIPDLKKTQEKKRLRRGLFSEAHFTYDPETDTYRCPSGKILKPKSFHKERQNIDYSASRKDCAHCELRPQCTRNKRARTLKRHLRQDALDQMRGLSRTAASKRDIRTRKHLMERTFAHATRYGFDRARWRGLWRVSIQEYITAAIQNIQKLIKYGQNPRRNLAVEVPLDRQENVSVIYIHFMNFLICIPLISRPGIGSCSLIPIYV